MTIGNAKGAPIPESLNKYPPQKRHLAHILRWYPDALSGKMLDLGSGAGSFLIQASEAGANIVGIEPSAELIALSLQRARAEGLHIDVEEGSGENLPFPDSTFRFINMAEVIEHVEDPQSVLDEVRRVLAPGGGVYVSVPNRFGMYDPHVHTYLVNWLPRALAMPFLKLIGRKPDDSAHVGRQQLTDMHYYTFAAFTRLARGAGFDVIDIRSNTLQNMPLTALRRCMYRILYRAVRPLYFDTFHFGLIKR